MVEALGIEPRFAACRTAVLPLDDTPKYLAGETRTLNLQIRNLICNPITPQRGMVIAAGVDPASSRLQRGANPLS